MSLNILVLIEFLDPSFFGGSGKVLFETSKVLAEKGHSIDVICRSVDYPEGFDKFSKVSFLTFPDIAGNQIKKLVYYREQTKNLFLKKSKEIEFDLIIIHSSVSCLGLFPVLKETQIPIIYYFHSPWNKEYEILANEKGMTFCGGTCPLVSILSAIRKRHEAKYLKLASGIVTLSKSMQQIMLDTHPFTKNIPKEIIPGGANGEVFFPAKNRDELNAIRKEFALKPDDFLIISSRRMVPRTGVDVLIKAFAKVKKALSKRHEGLGGEGGNQRKEDGDQRSEGGGQRSDKEFKSTNLKLILTGGGVSADDLKQLAVDLGIQDDVIFTGYVSEQKLAEYYRCCDLFVMPTKQLEGFGLSTVEAMASGLPVIGTNIGGTPEILSKISNDLVIHECSVEAIAGKIEEFLGKTDSDFAELREQSIACAKEHFTWEKHVKQFLELVSRIKKINESKHGTY